MAKAIELLAEINTSAFFYQLLFIHNYRRMNIFYGLDAAGMKSFMGLDQGVNSCLSLYHNIEVLSFWLSLEVDYINSKKKKKNNFSDLLLNK